MSQAQRWRRTARKGSGPHGFHSEAPSDVCEGARGCGAQSGVLGYCSDERSPQLQGFMSSTCPTPTTAFGSFGDPWPNPDNLLKLGSPESWNVQADLEFAQRVEGEKRTEVGLTNQNEPRG